MTRRRGVRWHEEGAWEESKAGMGSYSDNASVGVVSRGGVGEERATPSLQLMGHRGRSSWGAPSKPSGASRSSSGSSAAPTPLQRLHPSAALSSLSPWRWLSTCWSIQGSRPMTTATMSCFPLTLFFVKNEINILNVHPDFYVETYQSFYVIPTRPFFEVGLGAFSRGSGLWRSVVWLVILACVDRGSYSSSIFIVGGFCDEGRNWGQSIL